jgi:hypothetical protein
MYGMVATHALPQAEPEHTLQRRELSVDGGGRRLLLQPERLVPLDRRGRDVDRLRPAEYGIEPRQPRRLQIAEALASVVGVVGDDEISQVVVRDVSR